MDESLDSSAFAQVLSQNEVENLLAQVSVEESTLLVHSADQQQERRARDSIQPYDFRHPVFLSESELRRLRVRHEGFIRALAARLSVYLRMEFTLQMSKLQTTLYRRFTETLSNPTCLTLFKAEPLPGVCILEVSPRLGLTIVDRLLGGSAHAVNAEHEFTEIEVALLEQAVQVILGEWCSHWKAVQELRPVVLGTENTGRFLQTAPHDTVMLVLSMEARLGDCSETLQLCFPYYTLEPLIRSLSQASEERNVSEPSRPAAKPKWNPDFDDILVQVSAAWSDLELSAREIVGLKVGDVIELSPASHERISVRLAGTPRFEGRLGTRADKWAVQIDQALKR